MKIHDKFVIELAEVIKGYGNDYRVEEPFHLPCDYKFYEIGGVAISEESFQKMKPLDAEINAVLEDIQADLLKYEADCQVALIDDYDSQTCMRCTDDTFRSVERIINKYKRGEQE